MCLASANHKIQSKVDAVDANSESSEDKFGFFIGAIDNGESKFSKEWNVELKVEDLEVKFKVDTGAQCNVMPLDIYQRISNKKPAKSSAKLMSYSGHRIKTIGKNTLIVSHKRQLHPVEFQITNQTGATPLLGLQTCLELELLKRVYAINTEDERNEKVQTPMTEAEQIMADYADVFKGLCCLDGSYHIKIDKSVNPVVHPPRKVPFALKDQLKTELDRMENIGAITKVTEPTEWVNSIVITEKKNGKVRVCLDPRDLNKAIKQEHYLMKTVEEIAAQLHGATIFSTLDASSGFWHVKLDEPSSK